MAGMNGMGTEASAVDHPDPTIIDFVENSGLVPPGKYTRFERLPGGVSSDIWLVHADDRSFCVKRALAQLRVAADWRALRTDDALLKLQNVVVTPHLAWLTTETLEGSLSVISENCRRLRTAEQLLHRVV